MKSNSRIYDKKIHRKSNIQVHPQSIILLLRRDITLIIPYFKVKTNGQNETDILYEFRKRRIILRLRRGNFFI